MHTNCSGGISEGSQPSTSQTQEFDAERCLGVLRSLISVSQTTSPEWAARARAELSRTCDTSLAGAPLSDGREREADSKL